MAALYSGSNITITTTNSGSAGTGAGSITFSTQLNYNSVTQQTPTSGASLTLIPNNNITIAKSIDLKNTDLIINNANDVNIAVNQYIKVASFNQKAGTGSTTINSDITSYGSNGISIKTNRVELNSLLQTDAATPADIKVETNGAIDLTYSYGPADYPKFGTASVESSRDATLTSGSTITLFNDTPNVDGNFLAINSGRNLS